MSQKVRESKGLTVVEMLCATLILILLALMLNTGMQMAMENYRRMVLRSEVDLLLSSLSNVLADELRYASNVVLEASPNPTKVDKYNSPLYGKDTKLSVKDGEENKGQVYAGAFPVLPDGAYGGQMWNYGVPPEDGMSITYDKNTQTFEVKIKVSEMQANGTFSGVSAEQTFNVRCLNPNPSPSPSP